MTTQTLNAAPLTPAESWIMRSVPLEEWTTPVEAAPRLSQLADVARMSEWAYLYLETLAGKGYVERRTLKDGTPQYRKTH
ncbi:MAG TPA: hypothetical protein VNW46_13600 [Gemmatimonadaceae bacterium]|jgi:hypothetical protein|nr:hypothetical protein [Gemmatimonadaceae bacterium]